MYSWIIYLHIAAAFTFILAHGVSAFVGLRVRTETNPERVRALLELVSGSLGLLYPALLVLLLTGIGGGFVGSWWGHGWIWAALVLFIVLMGWMMARGSRYYTELAVAFGAKWYGRTEAPNKTPEQAIAMLKSSRPMELAAVGFIGLLGLLYLMLFKPF